MRIPSDKTKAPLNRTLQLTSDEISRFSRRLLHLKKRVTTNKINGRIINQDIFAAVDYLPDSFVDLMFVDPPYNISKKFKLVSFTEMKNEGYEKWLNSWLKKMLRLLKPDASVYICGHWKSSGAILNVAGRYLTVRNRITWEREKGRGSDRNWKNCSEDIWFFTNSGNYTFNIDKVKMRRKVLAPYRDAQRKPKDWAQSSAGKFRDTHPSNIWNDISVPFWSMPENTEHPTQKPEKLLTKIILASSDKGDMIFDPFLGSGTTAVVAKKLGRKFVGVEIDKHYCCLAEKRLLLAEKDKRIQGYENGVFWERNTLIEQVKTRRSKVKRR